MSEEHSGRRDLVAHYEAAYQTTPSWDIDDVGERRVDLEDLLGHDDPQRGVELTGAAVSRVVLPDPGAPANTIESRARTHAPLEPGHLGAECGAGRARRGP